MPLRLIEMTKENKFSVIYKPKLFLYFLTSEILVRIIFGAITQNIRNNVKYYSIADGIIATELRKAIETHFLC